MNDATYLEQYNHQYPCEGKVLSNGNNMKHVTELDIEAVSLASHTFFLVAFWFC